MTIIFISMCLGFSWVYRDFSNLKYKEGVQDEKIGWLEDKQMEKLK